MHFLNLSFFSFDYVFVFCLFDFFFFFFFLGGGGGGRCMQSIHNYVPSLIIRELFLKSMYNVKYPLIIF